MGKTEYLGLYAKGWGEGDVNTILQSVAEDFTFDDPNVGHISKADFSSYFTSLKNQVDPIRDRGRPFMELSEVISGEAEGVLTAWCWWSIPGTAVQGSGLIKVSERGVLSERITYYTKLPE